MNRSLRQQLLAWVLIPLLIWIVLATGLGYQSAQETASVVQDRLLLGSARMIAQEITFEDGTFQNQIPPAALELFQSPEFDRIYYRITTGTGHLLAGYSALPVPKPCVATDTPYFFAASMHGEEVRIATFFQPVIGNLSALPVMVEVAQTLHAQQKMTHDLWLHTLSQQLLILVLSAVCILFGLRRGLQPLVRLRRDVLARQEGSLQLLHTDHIPSELTPLVEAFNDYLVRIESYTRQHNSFVQNAAHQLRTPLAVLGTQISDATRAATKSDAQQPLQAAHQTLQRTTRLVNQFLTLSSAQAWIATMRAMSTQDCCNLMQEVLEQLAGDAHNKQIDLGFERHGIDTVVLTDQVALREIAVNLIDNAIRYTPPGGVVTARVQSSAGQLAFSVQDNGPGVAPHQREQIFERFFRVDGTASSGSGLGLAIVKELVAQCAGSVHVDTPVHGTDGFLITVIFSATSPLS